MAGEKFHMNAGNRCSNVFGTAEYTLRHAANAALSPAILWMVGLSIHHPYPMAEIENPPKVLIS